MRSGVFFLAAWLLLGTGAVAQDATTREPASEVWAADIAAFEAQDDDHPPVAGGVVFIGSSSIRMWTTLAQDFPGVALVNRGFGGSEIRDATRYVDRIVAPHAPRLVVLYAGDNDLMNGRTPAQVADDFRAFVQRVRSHNASVRVAYIAIKPSPSRAQLLDAARDSNTRIAQVAGELGKVDVIDIFTPMLGADGQPRAELFLPDMLHLNAEGYRLWTRIVAPYLQ